MPLEHLLAALERDASTQAETLLSDARAAADAIAAEAEEAIARRRRDVLGARESELRVAAQVALGEARRAGRRTVLEARQRLLERVFAAARALFPEAMAGEAYRAALPRHVAAALQSIGDVPAAIHCPDGLVATIRTAVAQQKHLSVDSDARVAAGFRLATTDGAVEVDYTLDGQLERLKPRLALAVLERLGAQR
ncbi:MAG TPA: V-type ATP synthase subunit E [Gemmatimonadales bacterium]|nr:V-type ATP synthase subunit E [Gemmatimonadales bacterium]